MRLLQLRFTNINSLAGTWEIDFTNADFRRQSAFCHHRPDGQRQVDDSRRRLARALCHDAPHDGHTRQVRGTRRLPRHDEGGRRGQRRRSIRGGRPRVPVAMEPAHEAYGRLSEDEVELVAFASPEDRTGRVIASQKRLWESEIQRITRMSFPIFTRSVLLAQGAFSNFLKAADDERANLLEKITGTDLYSAVSMKIFEKNRSARDSLDMAVARLEGMQILSDEDRPGAGTKR